MSNQHENKEFREACKSVGVRGKDWQGNKALQDCSKAFHNAFQGYERSNMSYSEISNWVRDWWSLNDHKYSGW